MEISADAYQNEPARYPSLYVVDLKAESASVTDSYGDQPSQRVA